MNTNLDQRLDGKLSSADLSELLKLHTAEYNMLQSRATSLMTAQAQAASLFFISIALIANTQIATQLPRPFVIWGGFLLLHIIAIFQATVNVDALRSIDYVEGQLRPVIEALLNVRHSFWQYEPWLSEQRANRPILIEWVIPVCTLGLYGVALFFRFNLGAPGPFATQDVIGILINLMATFFLVALYLRAFSMRRRWFKTKALPTTPEATAAK